LFLSKRARPDLQQVIGFLTTWVKHPYTDDWKKLHRVIKYLRGTKDLKLTLEADNTHMVNGWVDRRGICCALWHVKPNCNDYEYGQGFHLCQFIATET
jgi:hypothetical protein